MKIFLYCLLLGIEYILAKLVILILSSMVFNSLAPVVGIFLAVIFLLFMISVWRYGSRQIRS